MIVVLFLLNLMIVKCIKLEKRCIVQSLQTCHFCVVLVLALSFSMSIWLCSLSAAEEGQRSLAHPYSLVQFLGSYIDSTAEQSLLHPDSIMAWLQKTSGSLPHIDHAQNHICNSTLRKTTSYSHDKMRPIVMQSQRRGVSGSFHEITENKRSVRHRNNVM